jgi:hypothetical protein
MKSFTSFFLFLAIIFGSSAQANDINYLISEANEMINYEFYENAHREVVKISGHKFEKTSMGMNVKANVVSRHPESKMIQRWTCVVTFIKEGINYTPADIDCR